MQITHLAVISSSFVGLATSVYLNFQQHAIISELRSVVERSVLMPSPDDYATDEETDDYVRGYHQATEDMGCVPSASARYAAVEAWKKRNGFTQLDERQREIADRIEKAIAPVPTKEDK